MASSNVTLAGDQSRDFEADATERTATLQVQGGLLTNRNVNARTVWINENGGTVDTTNGNATSVPIGPGDAHRLPRLCRSFTFKAVGGAEFLKYTKDGSS